MTFSRGEVARVLEFARAPACVGGLRAVFSLRSGYVSDAGATEVSLRLRLLEQNPELNASKLEAIALWGGGRQNTVTFYCCEPGP